MSEFSSSVDARREELAERAATLELTVEEVLNMAYDRQLGVFDCLCELEREHRISPGRPDYKGMWIPIR